MDKVLSYATLEVAVGIICDDATLRSACFGLPLSATFVLVLIPIFFTGRL